MEFVHPLGAVNGLLFFLVLFCFRVNGIYFYRSLGNLDGDLAFLDAGNRGFHHQLAFNLVNI